MYDRTPKEELAGLLGILGLVGVVGGLAIGALKPEQLEIAVVLLVCGLIAVVAAVVLPKVR